MEAGKGSCHLERRMWRRALTLEVEDPLIETIHGRRRRSLGTGRIGCVIDGDTMDRRGIDEAAVMRVG